MLGLCTIKAVKIRVKMKNTDHRIEFIHGVRAWESPTLLKRLVRLLRTFSPLEAPLKRVRADGGTQCPPRTSHGPEGSDEVDSAPK